MLRDLKYRVRALFRRRALDRELEDELRFHLERAVEKQVRAGVPRAEAERRARIEFGGLEQIAEQTRAVRGVTYVDALAQDVRYAWRGMRGRRGFTAAVVLTLGLGIGANVAMFGVVDRLLVRAPSYLRAPERVHRVHVNYVWDGRERTERNFEYLTYQDLKRITSSAEQLGAFAYRTLPVGAGADTEELTVAAVSASWLDLFDVEPALGRFFTAAEDVAPAGAPVAVLGYGFWRAAYGGRGTVLGERIHIGETSYTIIGVAPRGFDGTPEGSAPVAFVPITAYAYARQPDYAENYGWSWLEVLVRRRPESGIEAVTSELTAAFHRSWELQRERVDWLPSPVEARVAGLLSPVLLARGPDATPDAKVAAWVMGVAFIVLLIAAANVINLLLVRAVHRRREIALRLALGVTRPRLVQQLLMETLLLAVMGGAAGLLLARWGGSTLRALFLGSDATGAVVTDARTLLFTALLTLGLALLTGLTPALQALRADLGSVLKAGMRDSTYRGSPLRTALLLFQAALSVVLLVGAGLFVRSLQNVRAYRLGYDVEPLMLVDTNLRGTELNAAGLDALSDRLLAVAAATPGVRSASLAGSVPFFSFEGRGAPHVPGRDSLQLLGRYTLQLGSPGYFATAGTRIVRGRGFDATDVAGAPPIIVVSRNMADAIWPSQDPIGQQIRIGSDTMPLRTVVGVAEDISARRIGRMQEFWYYLPVAQYRVLFGPTRPNLLVRVHGTAADHVEAVRQRLQRELPGNAYVRVRPFTALVEPQQRSWRIGAMMFVTFAALALVVASIGLYSVIAYAVAQRTRELGIRIALGASVASVIRLVVRQGVLFAVIGVIAGGAAAWYAARFIEPLLFSASARDPQVYGLVAGLLLTVALAATVRPALRAARVDPTVALRAE